MNSPILVSFILIALVAGPTWQLQTSIMIGNANTKKAEVYTVTFDCTQTSCTPRPLQPTDKTWSSPYTDGISEMKPVVYKGKYALLMTTMNGVIIYEYPSGAILFQKEMESTFDLNIHSAEVLPDGNVLVCGSRADGVFGVLYPDGTKVQAYKNTTWEWGTTFAHGAVYHKGTGYLFAGGYLKILVIQYSSGANGRGVLKVVNTISLDKYYDEPNHNEGAAIEDGIHDMYPVDGEPDNIFVSTGEHVFTLNVKDYSITKHPSLYTIPSKNSRNNNVAVKDKGGVKGISKDKAAYNVVIAKPSPWFKETQSVNYWEKVPVLVWSMPYSSANDGFCYYPDFDLTNKCKINIDKLQPIAFYKARVFKWL